MRKYIYSFLVICIALSSMNACAPRKPIASLKQLSGKTLTLAELQGRWIIINYWASWCGECYQEIPEINRFAEQYKDQVAVFGVSYDDAQGEKLRALVIKMGVTYPTLTEDPKALWKIEHIGALPVTLIINPQGQLLTMIYGRQSAGALATRLGLAS